MSEESTVNGADAEGRERPSWYVPIQPIPETHHKSLAEVFEETFKPVPMTEEEAAETKAYLDQFLVPRDS